MLWGHDLVPFVSLDARVTANEYKPILRDVFYPIMNLFFSTVTFRPLHRARRATQCLDKSENDVNRVLPPLQSAYLNPVEHREILDECV